MTEKIGVSYGTLTLLGLNNARPLARPTTAHFLLGENCVYSCKFCSQASSSDCSQNMLSRITWPQKPWSEIGEPLAEAIASGAVKRICLQVVEAPGATPAALALARKIRAISSVIPVSVCVTPSSVSRVRLLIEAGASTVGLPVDVASSSLHEQIKGRGFHDTWEVLRKASEMWPGRISTHFIAGLGETEEDIVSCIAKAYDLGITVGLFAFTPVRGTLMQDAPAPSLSSYRRVQLAAYCLSKGGSLDWIEFRDGRVFGITIPDRALISDIQKGIPFETSGCSHCNRPYYNERPGQAPMNYPRPLTAAEAQDCLLESELDISRLKLSGKGKEANR